MTDIALRYRPEKGYIDLAIEAGDLQTGQDLLTAVIVSLFTNRRASEDDPLPHDISDRQGWWGDGLPILEGYEIGSKLWLLSREKQTQETLNRAIDYATEALQWMLSEGVASRIRVQAEYFALGKMALLVEIWEPENSEQTTFAFGWAQFHSQVEQLDESAIEVIYRLTTEGGDQITTQSGDALILER